MNKFADLLEALKGRQVDEGFKKLLETVDRVSVPDKEPEPELRLPYSSDPPPIEEPWAS